MIKLQEHAFRTNTDDYFRLSGIREYKKLSQHPFVVFKTSNKKNEDDTYTIECEVCIIDSVKELLALPEDTQVIAQWGGQYRSDFFAFKVQDLKDFIALNPKENYQIV